MRALLRIVTYPTAIALALASDAAFTVSETTHHAARLVGRI